MKAKDDDYIVGDHKRPKRKHTYSIKKRKRNNYLR